MTKKAERKMKAAMAWAAVMDNGKFEPADGDDRAPFLYSTRKAARRLLPGGWRIIRVKITEVP